MTATEYVGIATPREKDKDLEHAELTAVPAAAVDVEKEDSKFLQQGHPADQSSIFGRALFSWATKLLRLGNERQLQPQDIWPLQPPNQVVPSLEAFSKAFEAAQNGVIRSFFYLYKQKLILLGVMQVVSTGCDMYGPAYVLPQIIRTVEAPQMDWAWAMFLVWSFFGLQVLSAILKAHIHFVNDVIGIQFTACLRSKLFQKALVLDATSRKQMSSGDMANLFSVDVVNVSGFSLHFNMLWIVPIQIIVTLALIERQVGWSIFMGVVALLAILLLTGAFGALTKRAQEDILKQKDRRMQLVNELFGAIQLVKFHAWEEKWADKVISARDAELSAITRFIKTLLVLVTSMYTTPVLITVVVFATYVLWMQRLLTVSIVFTTLALFKTLQEAFILLPSVLLFAIQAVVSAKRIATTLAMAECNPDNVQRNTSTSSQESTEKPIAIEIQDGTFSWDAESTPIFSELNLRIHRGEFVVIHGTVGAGKSSLGSILLGELHKVSGSVSIDGRVAYVAQQPWILNATIRDNILFGKPFDAARYQRVIEACALVHDLELFPAGDRTEIGLKGINLSGGQKARVSLARACYSDADVYVMDTPLSAVDAIVAQEIFTKCFQGFLRHKTLVLITHNIDIIQSAHVDRVFLVDQGQLRESTKEDQKRMQTQASSLEDNSVVVKRSESALSETAVESTDGALIVEEERAQGRVSKEVVGVYLQAIGGWWALAIMVFATLATEGMRVASDMWLSSWGKHSHDSDKTRSNLFVYIGLILGLCLMTVVQIGVVLAYGVRGSRKLFTSMFYGVLYAPMRFFDVNPIGRLLNRFGDDIFQCDLQLPMSFAPILVETATTLSKLVTSIGVMQYMGLLLPPLVYIYVRLALFFLSPLRDVNRIKKVTLSPLLTLVNQGIDGAVTIRAFGESYLDEFNRQHDVAIDDYSAACYAYAAVNQWFSLRVNLLSSSLVFAILVGSTVMHERLSSGLIALVITYGLSIPANLAGLVNMWASMETALIAPERIHEYAMVPKEGERDNQVNEWPKQGQIEFNKVSFRYKEEDPLVLQDVSFTVNAGEKIGIVGRTGAGKSSLIMALFRINEVAAGTIAIDGVDTATIGLKQLRSSLAIIPQQPVLFKGTLRNYLDPFEDFSDDALWDSLKKVHMTARISVDDARLEQLVEENGENFSVGERQMLCMARALLHRAKIVVLDEATAAIDHATDQLLQSVIREEFASSTVLTIAHRLDTVLDYNRIFVFDQGRLVQCDTPAALAANNDGIFHAMVHEGGYADRLHLTQNPLNTTS